MNWLIKGGTGSPFLVLSDREWRQAIPNHARLSACFYQPGWLTRQPREQKASDILGSNSNLLLLQDDICGPYQQATRHHVQCIVCKSTKETERSREREIGKRDVHCNTLKPEKQNQTMSYPTSDSPVLKIKTKASHVRGEHSTHWVTSLIHGFFQGCWLAPESPYTLWDYFLLLQTLALHSDRTRAELRRTHRHTGRLSTHTLQLSPVFSVFCRAVSVCLTG